MKTDRQKDNIYQRLPVACNLCATTLEECAIKMSASFTYELNVGERLFPYAAMLLKTIGAITREHPFAPYINLKHDPFCESNEWYIVNGTNRWQAYGSEGV